MKYKKLGHTDIEVSRICLGTMTFGEQNNQEEADQQMDYALDAGVNFFDTAELYAVPAKPKTQGLTEEFIGNWIEKRKTREKIILATKIVGPSPNLTYIRSDLNFSDESIDTALEGSMRRLKTDYIDLYQLHWPERKTNMFGNRSFPSNEKDDWKDNFLEIANKMNNLIKKGSIRSWGLSNETPWGAMHILHLCDNNGLERPVSIQNPYSLLNRTYEIGLSEVSMKENIGLLAYSPMAFGLLSGKYHKKTDKPNDRLNQFKDYLSRYNSENCYQATAKYLKIAEEKNMSLATMSLAFVTQQAFTTSNIIGATSLTQLKENIASINIELDTDCIQKIEAVQNEIPNPAP